VFIFLIHQLSTRIWFGCIYALYGAYIFHRIFPFSGLDRIHGWWCDKGCGPPVLYRAREIPFLWISRPWGLIIILLLNL